MIHCIGDSHSAVFGGKEEMQPIWPVPSDNRTPFFKCYRIGAATAYQLENKIPIIDEIIRLMVNKENDHLVFCFGEVDIRAHLIKQMDLQNKTVEEVVKECVDRYMIVLKYYKSLGFSTIAWGPIASWHESKPYTGGPSFGTCFDRNVVTKEFNRYLEECCNREFISFVSIFNNMVDDNNITKPEYLDDWEGSHIHLNQKSMPLILNAFDEKKLI